MSSPTPLPVHANDGPLTAGHRDASASSSASKSSATKEAIIAAIQQHREQSSNPYRQDRAQPEESLSRVSSREAESELSVRLKKPARAVFEDLPTAHLSITSRLARTKNRTPSNKLLAAEDDDNAIPLQDLHSAKHPRDTSFFRNLPLPPSPAVIYDERHGNDDYQDDYITIEKGGRTESPIQPDSMLASITNAFASMSSPLTRETPPAEAPASFWPRDSLELDENTKRRSATRIKRQNGNDKLFPSTPFCQVSKQKGHADNNTRSSMPYFPDDNSIYHSNLGGAPSGSAAPRSRDRGSGGQLAGHQHGQGGELSHPPHQYPEFQLSPTPLEQNLTLPQLPRTRNGYNPGSSLHEGSTIGNIYKQYGHSDTREEFDNEEGNESPNLEPLAPAYVNHQTSNRVNSSSSSSNGRLKNSAPRPRKQRRAERLMAKPLGKPPVFALPTLPNDTDTGATPSSSRGIGHSSSYGDSQKLLEIPQDSNPTKIKTAMSRSDRRQGLLSPQPFPEFRDPHYMSAPRQNENNPFLAKHGPQLAISPADNTQSVYDDGPSYDYAMVDRLPLERDVSKALRRASGFSAYSDGSTALERLGEQAGIFPSKSIENLRRQNVEDTPPSDSEEVGDQANGFYHQSAIPLNWTSRQQNVVRVPINHNGSFPDSPPESSADNSHFAPTNPTPEDDLNDWETVGESAFGFDCRNSNDDGFIGGRIHRAGSSIADTSEEGTRSLHIPQIDEFSSTLRITQHPGAIHYFGDYRQRELKKTKIPVFFPVFGEHKVNGYLADSTRIRPPLNPFNYAPPPLDQKHANPFTSPPPEVMPPSRARRSRLQRRSGLSRRQTRIQANQVPSSLTTLQSEQHEESKQNRVTESAMKRISASERGSRMFDWMENFGGPGPAINLQPKFLDADTPDRPTSWQHVMNLANQSDGTGYNQDGSLEYSEDITGGASGNTTMHAQRQVDDIFAGYGTPAGKVSIKKGRDRSKFIKGPPGAFYQGLRSKKNSRRESWSERQRAARVPSRRCNTFPTSALRPLSLVADKRSRTPPNPLERRPSENSHPNEFVYRSPLAPPKRDSWKQMYTNSQLEGIQAAASADGVYDTQIPTLAGRLRDSAPEGSRRHLYETPRLTSDRRNDSIQTVYEGYAQRKKTISIVVLFLCNFFPPMLILYGCGYLDCIMDWWTGSCFLTFGSPQKRWAKIMLIIWGVAIVLGLVASLVFWFKGLNNHS